MSDAVLPGRSTLVKGQQLLAMFASLVAVVLGVVGGVQLINAGSAMQSLKSNELVPAVTSSYHAIGMAYTGFGVVTFLLTVLTVAVVIRVFWRS